MGVLFFLTLPLFSNAQCPGGGSCSAGSGSCVLNIDNQCDCQINFTVEAKCPPNNTLTTIGSCCLCPVGGVIGCPNSTGAISIPCDCEIIVQVKDQNGNVIASISSTGTSYPMSTSFTDVCNVSSTIKFTSPTSVQITCP